MVTKKKTSLAGYSAKKAEAAAATNGSAPALRGMGETVNLNLRLKRADWLRLHALGKEQGKTLQGLFIDGITALFGQFGLPPAERP